MCFLKRLKAMQMKFGKLFKRIKVGKSLFEEIKVRKSLY